MGNAEFGIPNAEFRNFSFVWQMLNFEKPGKHQNVKRGT